MEKNYYIGLDIGTDSVGWAVTDTEYNLLKVRGQDFWGSYLFEEANGATERRQKRTARRRYARTRHRILLLQSLFGEVSKVDPLFFLRLNNSSLFAKDKDGRLTSANSLFDDKDFADKHYFRKYPTIYHLRAALRREEITDIRLLYLALHHIVKNRGHFLFEGQKFDVGVTNTVRTAFEHINAVLAEQEAPNQLCLDNFSEVLDTLRKKQTTKSDRQKDLGDFLCVGKDKALKAMVKAITGGKTKLAELLPWAEDSCGDVKDICFEDAKFDEEKMPLLQSTLGEEDFLLVSQLKAIYDWSVLCKIMGEEKTISDAKVKIYQTHKQHLKQLKQLIKQQYPDAAKYKEMRNKIFRRQAKTNNYAAYIGMDKNKGFKRCSREDFYAFLKKELQLPEDIKALVDKGEFLPKQVSSANSVIPYQLNLQEMEAILANAEKYFPFLLQQSDGSTVSQKIKSLLTFRIPYYVGPLHTQSKFAWAVRNEGYENISITPWNFDKAINKDKSEEAFILRMTNKCTYLPEQDVLPKSSFLYSEFAFLNELNNLRINGQRNEEARLLIWDYAHTHKKVTLKQCLQLLKQAGIAPHDSTKEIFSGTDGDFKNSLSSWVDFEFLGDLRSTNREMCEQIITWITLISDKTRLEKRIRKEYGDKLTEEQIKRLKGFNYTGWGRMSKEFLDGIVCDNCFDGNGVCLTIVQAMLQKGENLMELLSDRYHFSKAVEEHNQVNSGKVTYKTVEDLYCSASVKRAIWRSLVLVKEIEKVCGGYPQKIFVETAREVNDQSRKGKRTVSRKQQLLDLYKDIKNEEREWTTEIEKTPDNKFNSDRLVLYYRQMGRCMYTGREIPLSDVFNVNICDIDHIWPQSKIKDDSLENRVLAYKTANQEKGDFYPIRADVRSKMAAFWRMLHDKQLIGDKKYNRLIRTTGLSEEELNNFIARQLVSTRQSTKEVYNLLKQMFPQTEVVYSKAGNANAFKDENKIIKVRELNDLHHAKDAYINIVAGNVWHTKFNRNFFLHTHGQDTSYNLKYLYTKDIDGAWKVAYRDKIKQIAQRNTCRVVRMTTDGHGQLFDLQPFAAGAKQGMLPLKQNSALQDTSRYGGYNNASTAYFMLVRSVGKKCKTMLSLEAYPLWLHLQTEGDLQAKLRYCTEEQGLKQPEILLDNIKINTLLQVDGSYVWIRGKSNESLVMCNATQLHLDGRLVAKLKAVSNYMRDRKNTNNQSLAAGENISAEDNLCLYDALVEKLQLPLYSGLAIKKQVPFLNASREKFATLSLEDQCVVLFEVLHLLQCNSVTSNFEELGGVKNAGKILLGKFIQDKDVKIIFQSPTGHYRRVVDIKQYL